jgi:hypothetical protein
MLFLALIVDPIYLCNQIRVRWFTKFIVIEEKSALILINYFATGSENNELGFGRINCHFVSSEPICDFLQLIVNVDD